MEKNIPPVRDLDRARFSQALTRALTQRGITQADLARELGVTQPTISDYVNAKKSPSRKNLARVVGFLDLDPTELTALSEQDLSGDVVLLPVRGRAAAGDGYINGSGGAGAGDGVGHKAFSREELRRLTNRNPDRLETFIVSGDSLAPEILPSSAVVYDPQEAFRGDGLYVLTVDEGEIVKRVQVLPGGALELLPINPAYKPELLYPVKEADTPNTYRSERTGLTSVVRVVGKVVAYSKPA